MSGRGRKGFTLIELLVVIAIIAILAAILFPVFARARAKARQAACQSNLKQLGLAIEMYSQDYDELFPIWGYGTPAANGVDGPPAFYSWDSMVLPYMKNSQILQCPDNPYGRGLRGYAITRYIGDPMGINTPCFKGDLPSPSRTVVLTEKGHLPAFNSGDCAAESFYQSKGATGAPGGVETKDFHQNGKNFLYADGHVKFASKGGGPYKDYFNYAGQACPLSGGHTPYESHAQGHCEFWPDWPYE